MPTGFPVVSMSDEQKYLFDLKGWICLPGLLSGDQLEAIRAHQLAFLHDRESLPPHERDNHGGPSEILLDHPAVVGVLNEILSHQGLASESLLRVPLRPHLHQPPHRGPRQLQPARRRRTFQLRGELPHLPDAAGEDSRRPDAGSVGAERGRPRRRRHHAAVGKPQVRLSTARSPQRARKRPVGDLHLPRGLGHGLHRGAVPHRDEVGQRRAGPAGRCSPATTR